MRCLLVGLRAAIRMQHDPLCAPPLLSTSTPAHNRQLTAVRIPAAPSSDRSSVSVPGQIQSRTPLAAMADPLTLVRETCSYVASQSTHVAIDQEGSPSSL